MWRRSGGGASPRTKVKPADTSGFVTPLSELECALTRSDKCGRSAGLLQAGYTVPTSHFVHYNEFGLMVRDTRVREVRDGEP